MLAEAKVCYKCKTEKPLTDFHASSKAKDGRQPKCKSCTSDYDKRPDRREKSRNRQRVRRQNPEVRAVEKASRHEYYQRPEVKAHNRKKMRKYRQTPQWKAYHHDYVRSPKVRKRNSEKARLHSQKDWVKEQRREYRLLHPEMMMVASARKRAEARGVPCTITASDIRVPDQCPILGIELRRGEGKSADHSPSLDRLVPELGYVPQNISVVSQRANRIKNSCSADIHDQIADWMDNPVVPETFRLPSENWRDEKHLLRHAKERANKTGAEFDLDVADIRIPVTCPILGIPLERGIGKRHDGSPTLDRIDPSKGYVRGNVAVLSHRANLYKNDGTSEEHRKIAAWMRQTMCVD